MNAPEGEIPMGVDWVGVLANMGPIERIVPRFGHLSPFWTACWGILLACGIVTGGLWSIRRRKPGRPAESSGLGWLAVFCFVMCLCISWTDRTRYEQEKEERRKQLSEELKSWDKEKDGK
jgi:hypothetical protein